MIPHTARDHFWLVVERCLVEFHGYSQDEAVRECSASRREVESRPTRLARDLFYHHEPFDVACDVAGQAIDWDAHQEAYQHIREESWKAVTSGAEKP